MTDKELRKLSRLELLELLLEAGKENEKLKEQVKTLKLENEVVRNIERLSAITEQTENALKYANGIASTLKFTADKSRSPSKGTKTDVRADSEVLPDIEIYKSVLRFFAKNDDKLSVFPSDIENNIRLRIKGILERKK